MHSEAVRIGIDLIKTVKEQLSSKKKNTRLNDEICIALRGLYFMPDGVLSLLKEMERGEQPPQERLQQALTDFNDREWKVQAALQSIDFKRLVKDLGMTLQTAHVLEGIRYGKTGLRSEIQEEVNYYGQGRVRPDKRKLRRLIASIEMLNSEIEKVENKINVSAKEKS